MPRNAGTAVEQPAGTIASDIEETMRELEGGGDEQAEDTGREAADPEGSEETEKPAGEDTAEAGAESEDEAAGDSDEESPAVEAPIHWKQDDREAFASLSKLGEEGKKAQEFMLRRHKEMEGDYTRKTQANADLDRDFGPIKQIIDPYRHQLQQINMTPTTYLQNLINADRMLSTNGVEGLKHIAQAYGIDLAQLAGKEEDQGEINALKADLKRRDDMTYQSQQASTVDQINKFFEEKAEGTDEAAHPYAEEVLPDMIALAKAAQAAGQPAPTLKDLYDKAVYANPETRQKILAAADAAKEKQRKAEARKKAEQARRASSSIEGSPGDAEPSDDLSLRDMISRQLQ